MRLRLALFLSFITLLAFYTSVKAAEVWPERPWAAAALAAALVGLIVAWQFGYRSAAAGMEAFLPRALAWGATFAMGLWATFVLLCAAADVVSLLLSPFLKARPLTLLDALPASLLALSALLAVLGLKQVLEGPEVKETTLSIEGLPKGLDGLRIVQISDLHVGPTIRRGYVERVAAVVRDLQPDLITLTGDLVDGKVEALEPQLSPLASLRAPLGVYYVTGNHEYYWGAAEWIAKAAQWGFVPLLNAGRVVERLGARLWVAGVTDPQGAAFLGGHASDVRRAAAGGEGADFRLLLAHRPDCREAEAAGFDLQLSGHTHGGQFFPWSLLVALFHRHYRGLHRWGRLWLYVSAGAGYWGPPHRFGVPSEIALLRLVSAEAPLASGAAVPYT